MTMNADSILRDKAVIDGRKIVLTAPCLPSPFNYTTQQKGIWTGVVRILQLGLRCPQARAVDITNNWWWKGGANDATIAKKRRT